MRTSLLRYGLVAFASLCLGIVLAEGLYAIFFPSGHMPVF